MLKEGWSVMSTDSTRKTILVALGVCLVCSVLVSSAAVGLKSIQDRNRELDKLKNILIAGNISYNNTNVRQLFKEKIEADVIDLNSGAILPQNQYPDRLNPEEFDIKSMAKNPQYNRKLTPDQDLAQIKQIPRNMVVYRVKNGSQIEEIILPIYGKGLWSTMYGFIALDRDLKTVAGFTFYEHGETPGLGGEVDNPAWKRSWIGKKVFDESGNLQIEVVKGKVNPADSQAQYQVDGLSGATLTTRGVNNLVHFWLSDNGYGTFLDRLREGSLQ
jgi:Na+-transporting NADH:ubiquinone oxidoreductase subunit C